MKLYQSNIILGLLTLAMIVFPLNTVLAVENTFTTHVFIGNDLSAPTVPTSLSATAVSTSQIDLTWSASTDNVAVNGYHVFRDAVLIATTTGTTYSDVGLTSETTYAYTVSAFDYSFNESAQTATSSATTFSESTNPAGGGGNGAGGAGGSGFVKIPVISDVALKIEAVQTNVSWQTDVYAQAVLRYGLTADYEMGSVGGYLFQTHHKALLTNLAPNTIYYYEIEARGPSGLSSTYRSSFRTSAVADNNPPANAKYFKAVGKDGVINLTWLNPKDVDFAGVRIVRSTSFYPSDPFDGAIVYEGSLEGAKDTNVSPETTYYYALFTKDTRNNYSSGLLAAARLGKTGEPIKIPLPTETIKMVPEGQVDPKIGGLSLADFRFVQNGQEVPFVDGYVAIDADSPVTIYIPYSKVPEILKSIIVTLEEKDGDVASFLLRVNKDKSAYAAVVDSFRRSAEFNLSIDIIDYKNQGLKKIQGILAPVFYLSSWVRPSTKHSMTLGDVAPFILFTSGIALGGAYTATKKRKDYTLYE